MNLKEILQNAWSKLRGEQELVSPYPEQQPQQPAPTPSPQPTLTPQIRPRNPNWEKWKTANPKNFDEIYSGAQLAAKKYAGGNPQTEALLGSLLLDISGAETSGGQNMEQLSGGPGRGWFQFEEGQKHIPQDFDFNSATESADLAAKRITSGYLSNWGTPQGNWGTLNNPKNTNGKLTDYYDPETELNQYLLEQYKFQ